MRIAQIAGSRLDLHCSAAGKILLTFALRPQLAALVAQGLPVAHAEHPDHAARARSRNRTHPGLGYAVDDEECYEGVRCLAAPVWDASGGTRAALGVIASASTFGRRQNQEFAQRVLAAARDLSMAMGYDARPATNKQRRFIPYPKGI